MECINQKIWRILGPRFTDRQARQCYCSSTRPNEPSVWYYGTGEFPAILPASEAPSILGHGVFKSTDSGNTWTQLASTINGDTGFGPPPNDLNSADDLFDFVWDIEVHPTTGAVYVGGWGAVLVSTDGGNSWTNSLETNGNRADIEITSDGTVYAALSKDGTSSQIFGIYRQNGANWTDISPPAMVSDPFRIVLDSAPSDPTQLYALVQSNSAGNQTEDHQFFGSTQPTTHGQT